MNDYILVGVDGSPEAQLALRWALDAAERRGLPVRVLRAYQNDLDRWPVIGMAGYVPPPLQVEPFQEELDEAVRIARNRLGRDRVSGVLMDLDPAHALLGEAGGAALVVVGTTSPNKMSAVLLGSVATAVTAKAPCPVVVVRGDRRTGPIVVGTDGSVDSEQALAFAFEEAAHTGAALEVVYCWPARTDFAESATDTEKLLQDWLAESVAPYREKYPAVKVHVAVLDGRPRTRLIALSETASLTVVGSRGRGGVKGLLLGSVSQSLLHHANSPVAIAGRHEES
ncbi:universal stress protein [Kribbella sp. WER1]